MDKQFLEFWGHLMLATAKGQAPVDAFSRWMNQGMKGSGDIGEMFRRFYGLAEAGPAGDRTWESARKAFDDAFRTYLDLLQVVPLSQHEALKQRAEALEKTVAEQEALISTLRRELGESHAARGEVARGFEEIVQIQSEEFKKLTDTVGQFFNVGQQKEK